MVSVEKLVNDFYRKLNAVNSGKSKFYNIVDVMSFLNEAYQIWFENKVFSLETNERVRNDLRGFEIKKHELSCEKVDENCCKIVYPDNFYQRLNQLAIACNEDCCPDIEKSIVIRIVQSDDLQDARKNPFRKSDFKWEQLIAEDGGDGLYIYHDCSMDIKTVYIDYYRKPIMMEAGHLVECAGGYVKYDNSFINFKKDFEVSETFADRQVSDIAVVLASRDSGDYQGYQTKLQQILQLDKLYKI
jgi:hypothetical protein